MNLGCPACGVDVTPRLGPTGFLHCPTCNLILTRAAPQAVLGKVALKQVRADDLAEGPVVIGTTVVEEEPALIKPAALAARPPSRATPRFGLALIAEDVALHRQLIVDGLTHKHLALKVVATERGDELVTTACALFLRGEFPSLVILDLEMPGLNGYHAAVALRAIEKAFQRQPVPILFFSARVCDEAFQRAMNEVGNASYLNKAGAGPPELFGRLEQVLRTFIGWPALEDDEAKLEIER